MDDRITMLPPFAVRTAGLIRDQPFHSTPCSRQGDVMLTVCLGGRGAYRSPVEDAEVIAGMVGLVPWVAPGVLMADPRDPYVQCYCRWT